MLKPPSDLLKHTHRPEIILSQRFLGPLHMSPVDRAGPVSEISAHPLIPLKKSRRVHMKERAGSVTEISVFPTGISESGLKVAIWT